MRITSSFPGFFGANVLAAALWQSAPAPVSACSQLPVITVQLASPTVPSDGVLAGVLEDCAGCSVDGIRIVDAAGVRVAGNIEVLPQALSDARWFAFRPASPWTVGAHYTVSGPTKGTAPQGTATFTAVAPTSAEPMLTALLTTPQRGVTSEHCVQYDTNQLAGLCSQPSFYSSSVVEPQLELRLGQPAASQHAYRIVWSADGQPTGPEMRFRPGQLFVHAFEGAPREVCYELFATPLSATGSERRLGAECKRTEPDALGPRSGVTGDMTGTLAYCIVPPEGYRAQWCQTLAPGSAWCRPNTRMSMGCARAAAECSNADAGASDSGQDPAGADAAVVSADGAMSAAVAEAGTVADGDGTATNTGGDLHEEAPTTGSHTADDELADSDAGCSVRRSRSDGALWLLLSALSLGGLLRRRSTGPRRQRARGSR